MLGTTNTESKSDNFVVNAALEAIKAMGGELVDDATFERRREVCESCTFYRDVLFKGLNLKGCSVCSCPLQTKGRTKKYYSFQSLKVIDTKCPHKDGDKWDFQT